MKARDIMTRGVITIRTDTFVDQIVRLLSESHIGGLPVMDGEDQVVGNVIRNDLFLKQKGMPFSAVEMPTLLKQWVDTDRLTEIHVDARHQTAADVMTSGVVSGEG